MRVLATGALIFAAALTSSSGAAVFAQATPPDDAYGVYRIDADQAMGIDRFVTDSGETAALISDYSSGIVRRLFAANDGVFTMGPDFNTATPAELTVRFTTDANGTVTGLRLLRPRSRETTATRVALRKEEVSYTQADARLSATLISPPTRGRHPAIILLHGSGPLTRDKFGPYPHFFASLGLSVLVYDKRGSGSSTGLRMDASTATVMKPANYPDDLVDDALAALQFLQQRLDIDKRRIGVWGTSEGGMLATQVAARTKDVAFAINSSGFMEPLWETLRYQVRPLMRDAGATNSEIDRQMTLVYQWLEVARTGRGWEEFQRAQRDHIKAGGSFLFHSRGTYASVEEMRWDWDRVLSFNPQVALERVTCPVLALFGELDPLTPAERTAEHMRRVLSKAGNPDFTVRIFPHAGHSLSILPSRSRMAPGVFETLRSWIGERVRRTGRSTPPQGLDNQRAFD